MVDHSLLTYLERDGYLRDGTFISWDPETLRRCPWEKIYSGLYDEYKTSKNKSLAVFTELVISDHCSGFRKKKCLWGAGQRKLRFANIRLSRRTSRGF